MACGPVLLLDGYSIDCFQIKRHGPLLSPLAIPLQPFIGSFSQCRQSALQVAGVNLQLVAVRIEKVEGVAFAAILLPDRYPLLANGIGTAGEGLCADAEGDVSIFRQRAGARLVVELSMAIRSDPPAVISFDPPVIVS